MSLTREEIIEWFEGQNHLVKNGTYAGEVFDKYSFHMSQFINLNMLYLINGNSILAFLV